MKKLLAIGEALVDIFNNDEVKVGGAPLNVLGANSKLGGHSFFIGKISLYETLVPYTSFPYLGTSAGKR